MLVLVVDTATPAITAALAEVTEEGTRVLAERVTVDGKAHGERLAPQIEAALTEAGVKPRDLAAIVAGTGPGPFTGLRVGLMTAAAMGNALGVPTYGVCSLDGLGAPLSGHALVATDARRKEVYWAVYADGVRVDGPHVDRPAEVSPGAATTAVGQGALVYADVLGLPVPPDEPIYPSAFELARLAAPRILSGEPGERLVPLYLRRPDAVEPGARKHVS
ncbi:tRNA (adenosine(37)-N6)-threonylcarbamoyltransferase complex dimerization subunit type 1 TsaB [Hamadaea tsunoensis]|uniref:tRNA (adenosine(37)-N6)-threonylcarbamoyltransferase complex dimerization subunit type 1 TsaB n=1 Tax=Hamadaea tsunoensis TaxID=53368 RepID=UPI00040ED660|nr:tRNA (adenosine(37)-N6)-threonylcarbamoyltransferase complex dimerization subunit type 1 TsaB [Hamadaea tsunoensis]